MVDVFSTPQIQLMRISTETATIWSISSLSTLKPKHHRVFAANDRQINFDIIAF